MDKLFQLQKLQKEMISASLPLRSANLVFGEGNVDCAVMFVGEAPGKNEDLLKRPFIGRGGQLLDKMIESIGWRRRDVYITSIVKHRPPNNRDPLPAEIEAYAPYLARQIEIINPKVVATLGRFAMHYFLPLAKISRDHGHVFMVDGRFIFPLFHPAAALRSPKIVMSQLAEDFKKLPKVLREKIVPSVTVLSASPRTKKKPKK